jgi:hypothetical protein
VAYFNAGLNLTDAVCLCAGVSPRSRHSPLLCSRVSPHAVASLYRAHFLRIPHYLAFTTSRRPLTPLIDSNCLCPLTSRHRFATTIAHRFATLITHRFTMNSLYRPAILSSSLLFLIRIILCCLLAFSSAILCHDDTSATRHDDPLLFRHDRFCIGLPIQFISDRFILTILWIFLFVPSNLFDAVIC